MPSQRMSFQSETSDLSTLFQQNSSTMSTKARDEGGKMWEMYAEEAEKYNKAVTDAQKDDADGVLVFTGLFSAVVAVFIVESYKKLSPDSGDTTTALLTQISRQLGNNTNSPPENSPPFAPSTAILFVNALWFLSLIIAIVSAFYVMMVRQWTRRYSQTVQELKDEQRRVQACLFLGAQKYHMMHAVGLVPLPLHVSVFLFFTGLIVFLWPISHTMAIVITVAVASIGVLYVGLTILPIADDICPYFTPMSDASWYLWHAIFSASAVCFHWLLARFRQGYDWIWERFCGGSDSDSYDPSLSEDQSPRLDKLSKWSETLEDIIEKNKEHIKAGFRKNIFWHAKSAPESVDLKALTWLLQRPAMGDETKLQAFVDNIPEQTLIQLSSRGAESGEKTILEHLSNLFRSCTGASKLEEPDRSTRLLICLNAYHQIVKPSTLLPDEDYETVVGDVRSNFKDINLVRKLWDHDDPAIRVTSRSICALLARNLLRKPNSKVEEPERRWLKEVVGKPETEIFGPPLVHLSTRDHLNLQSFVFGVLSSQKGDLSDKYTARFAETLAVLMNAGSSGALSKEIFFEEISSFIERAEKGDYQNRDEVVEKLSNMFIGFFTETTP